MLLSGQPWLRCLASTLAVALAAGGCSVSSSQLADGGHSEQQAEAARQQCMSLERCYPRALAAFSGGIVSACVESLTCPQLYGLGGLGSLADPAARDAVAPPVAGAPLADRACTELLLVANSSWPYAKPSPPDGERAYTPPAYDAPAIGEACVKGEYGCETGAYCRVSLPLRQSGWTFCGECREYLPLGAPCEARDVCAEGVCIDGRCQELLPDGANCVLNAQCRFGRCVDGVCQSDFLRPARTDGAALGEPCQDELRGSCRDDVTLACVDGRCVARPDQGDTCDDDRDCRVLQHCRGGRCTAAECSPPKPPCPQCGQGQSCDLRTGTCQPIPQEGQSCSLTCAAGLVCDFGLAVCVPFRRNGRPCSDNWQCQSGTCLRDLLPYCDSTSGRPCSVPACDDCGICGEDPGVSACF